MKPFQFLTEVDLQDGAKSIQVEVEFLAPKQVKLKKNKPKLLQDFRVLQAEGCESAFNAPVQIELAGLTARGARNKVQLRVASVPDFVVMKAHALAGRDKPKDSYDICYCLSYFPGGLEMLAAVWRQRSHQDVQRAIAILRDKFASVDSLARNKLSSFLIPLGEMSRRCRPGALLNWYRNS